jgi:uncharacterized protein YqjF (DUF2071 family)
MNNRGIINKTEHRPYDLPTGTWVMKQIWRDLLFAHWPVKANELKPFIPHGLELDLWDGEPWISIVPFLMSGIRFRGLPPIPFTSRFLELNVRTYVTCRGKPGVYFFSLDATNRLAVETARALFHLPYMKARMSLERAGNIIRYTSNRIDQRGRSAAFTGNYKATNTEVFHAEPETLIHWLTERYCLYTSNRKGEILIGDIHHLPWNLQEAELDCEINTMAEAHHIALPKIAPIVTFTKRLDVFIWPIKKVDS